MGGPDTYLTLVLLNPMRFVFPLPRLVGALKLSSAPALSGRACPRR
jgi:hypothetical protein